MEKEQKINRKTKILISLGLIAFCCVCVAAAFWYGVRLLLYDNPRLVIRSVQLECSTGFWSGKTEVEREEKVRKFCSLIGIEPGKTGMFSFALRDMRKKIMQDQPEIEYLTITRILPDTISFRIGNRIPRVDAGNGFFLDDTGTFLRARYYSGEEKNGLPVLKDEKLNEDSAHRIRTTDPEIISALNFIRLVVLSEDPCIREIHVRRIEVIRKDSHHLRMELTYRDNPQLFEVKLPSGLGEDLLLRDITARLIPALNSPRAGSSAGRVIDLRYKGPAFSSPSQY